MFILRMFLLLFINLHYVLCEEGAENGGDSDTEISEDEMYQHVALLDLVFHNGRKRTCTGAIIHDNVVITAAHCFLADEEQSSPPELTLSFVVIGSKKMFESGYEQYLPIEKVIFHPHFKGWTADLALVYTFAGMTSDKPGKVLALDMSPPLLDFNVTLLSWGHCEEESALRSKDANQEKKPLEIEGLSFVEHYERMRDRIYESRTGVSPLLRLDLNNPMQVKKKKSKFSSYEDQLVKSLRLRKNKYYNETTIDETYTTASVSRFGQALHRLSTEAEAMETDTGQQTAKRRLRNHRSKHSSSKRTKNARRKLERKVNRRMRSSDSKGSTMAGEGGKFPYKRLSMQLFEFVSVPACKKIVERSLPAIYSLKDRDDIVCYASENHYVTASDSGAPALRRGRLVSITVGGADYEGDFVGIGMKMSCFCPWISANLPSGGVLECCKNCCDGKPQAHFLRKNRQKKG